MDAFEALKDITRAYCAQMGLPAPDGVPATPAAHIAIADAIAAIEAMPEHVSAATTEAAMRMQNATTQFRAFNTGMSCQVVEVSHA